MSNLFEKIRLYGQTAAHLEPSQVLWRFRKKLGAKAPVKRGYTPAAVADAANLSAFPAMPELDYDPAFLARFDCDEILGDTITLLHHAEKVDWAEDWHASLSTPLWQCNLHYFEFLLPLVKRHTDTGDARYLAKAQDIVLSWIEHNPRERGGWAWASYTISLRLVNWLAFMAELADAGEGLGEEFTSIVNESLLAQYVHLSQNLELDVLANHYLENLKALVIGALYFGDDETLGLVMPLLREQIGEQILPDGMHFELSPMYHKIILEDMLRVAICLKAAGRDYRWTVPILQKMCDCLYSMEKGADRTPLFNDSGDNVAKSKDALLRCASDLFSVVPAYGDRLPDSGYHFLEGEFDGKPVKLILDVGATGPAIAMGHSHCDMLSFEVFIGGEPVITNRGTYAYQDARRLEFKSSESHNTVHVQGVEQSECWSAFRMARYARIANVMRDGNVITATMVDQAGNELTRRVELDADGISVIDSVASSTTELVESVIIACPAETSHCSVSVTTEGRMHESQVDVAAEFGALKPARRITLQAAGRSSYRITFNAKSEGADEAVTPEIMGGN